MIITHQYFGYRAVLAQCPGLPFSFPLCLPPSANSLGWTRCWEGTQPGWVTPTNQRDIPDYKSCSTINAQVKEKEGGPSGLWCCLPKQALHIRGSTAQKWLNTCPSLGNRELIPPFALLELTALLHFSY